ncbi:TraX family protein [uncultured Bifidobacterium sp.]|uniref:TraX family protein n=1 Tax=uncultured Bifidobacterium sp. TaxID=165187 RepID=UPI00262DFD48|nr:TraX family protein [uncultured Bifidobacterium sp.]
MDDQREARMRGLSSFRLKVIGDALLTFSIAGGTVIPRMMGSEKDSMASMTILVVCEIVSWVAVPIFSWLLVSGYEHTSNAGMYAARLLALAVISEVPYDLSTSGASVDWSSQNPVFGLLIALLMLMVMDWARRFPDRLRRVIVVAVAASALVWVLVLRIGVRQKMVNVGLLIVAFVLVFRLLRTRENTMIFAAGLVGAMAFVFPALGVAILHFRNDELGYSHAWTRWAFYAFYPAMMLACVVIASI